ncbi:putative acetyltransferase [Tritonibacter multivorans]|uniref:Putative acetyltransferase n=1 Tax=Tritonibacter multivorans TaxID=928856 RepID=A0A0N7LZC8_9RHOB|nr:bifunctional helix-turn-helix transcriptional regulator/GNAT family N-acetyltransferase [Tritonibacter multivorans]MDA7422808.1 bifunctional helix-turn-helix transcriptional regulator/GNAT family N-acetyltransferase [Tritonibacter multivorans]CUH77305.1 putative acetyltransferase [Tritonibacter multivorans]SFD59197.1 MarR family protein [Tritonibacter multivorans]
MSFDAISRIRRFNRAVTRETGVLDHSFLGRGRPLGPARVLNAIGAGHSDLEALRRYLGLDKTVLSRYLAGLQKDGLLDLVPAPTDGRRRRAQLTPAGVTEFTAYEALSNTQAQVLLDRHPRPEALLAAMDLIASALGRDEVEIAVADPTDPRSVSCLEAYYNELAARFDQGFDVSLSADPEADDMRPPRGTFLLALSDGLPLGCVGLKGTDKGYGEIKRLWISPAARGMGLARRLMGSVEDAARDLGIGLLRLDTNSALPEAVALYQATGWTEIERFNEDPYPDYFFEKAVT